MYLDELATLCSLKYKPLLVKLTTKLNKYGHHENILKLDESGFVYQTLSLAAIIAIITYFFFCGATYKQSLRLPTFVKKILLERWVSFQQRQFILVKLGGGSPVPAGHHGLEAPPLAAQS